MAPPEQTLPSTSRSAPRSDQDAVRACPSGSSGPRSASPGPQQVSPAGLPSSRIVTAARKDWLTAEPVYELLTNPYSHGLRISTTILEEPKAGDLVLCEEGRRLHLNDMRMWVKGGTGRLKVHGREAVKVTYSTALDGTFQRRTYRLVDNTGIARPLQLLQYHVREANPKRKAEGESDSPANKQPRGQGSPVSPAAAAAASGCSGEPVVEQEAAQLNPDEQDVPQRAAPNVPTLGQVQASLEWVFASARQAHSAEERCKVLQQQLGSAEKESAKQTEAAQEAAVKLRAVEQLLAEEQQRRQQAEQAAKEATARQAAMDGEKHEMAARLATAEEALAEEQEGRQRALQEVAALEKELSAEQQRRRLAEKDQQEVSRLIMQYYSEAEDLKWGHP